MRAPFGGLAATLLLGLVGSARMDLATAVTPPQNVAEPAIAQQSPIDIRGDDLRIVTAHGLPALTFRYATHATLDVVNTGAPGEEATVRANVAPGDGEVRVGDRAYRLVQFHWHIPAEHRVDGERLPMEMHLVHTAADSSTLVVGVFLRAGASNAALAPLFSRLPKDSGGHATVTGVDIAALLPHHAESARYIGSLTTPPFTQGVHWIVLAPPIDVAKNQIAAFGALFPDGNSRPVQPLNRRTVSTDDRNFERDEGVSAPGGGHAPTPRP